MVTFPLCPASLSCACSATLVVLGVSPAAAIGPSARFAWYTVCFLPGKFVTRQPLNPKPHRCPQKPGRNPQPEYGTWFLFMKSVLGVSTSAEMPRTAKSPSCCTAFCTICRLVCGLPPSSWQPEKSILRPPGSSFLVLARLNRAL